MTQRLKEEVSIDFFTRCFYPRGTELQFNWDFTEFLGKKGSAIRYEGKGEDYKDGGIVKRASGTNEIGEIADTDQIFEYEGVGTSTETDDINKLIARSNNTLKELYFVFLHSNMRI